MKPNSDRARPIPTCRRPRSRRTGAEKATAALLFLGGLFACSQGSSSPSGKANNIETNDAAVNVIATLDAGIDATCPASVVGQSAPLDYNYATTVSSVNDAGAPATMSTIVNSLDGTPIAAIDGPYFAAAPDGGTVTPYAIFTFLYGGSPTQPASCSAAAGAPQFKTAAGALGFAVDWPDDVDATASAATFGQTASQIAVTVANVCVPGTVLDNQGCDSVPGAVTTSNRGACCDAHDQCYCQNGCKASSWILTNPFKKDACRTCNVNVTKCIGGRCGPGPSSCVATKSCGKAWTNCNTPAVCVGQCMNNCVIQACPAAAPNPVMPVVPNPIVPNPMPIPK